MTPGFQIETPRLILRPMVPDDAQAVCDLITPKIARNMGSVPPNPTVEETRSAIRHRRWLEGPTGNLAITLMGQPIGAIGMGGLNNAVGYWLAEWLWGQGIMSEALSAYLDVLFGRFQVPQLRADRFEDNPASGKLLTRFGFRESHREMGDSLGRLSPSPCIVYCLNAQQFWACKGTVATSK